MEGVGCESRLQVHGSESETCSRTFQYKFVIMTVA